MNTRDSEYIFSSRGGIPHNLPVKCPPGNQGLYDSSYEKDGCGIGLVADILGRKTHRNVADALTILKNLQHRGATGADPMSGDGCGILTQIPDALFRAEI